MYKYVHLIFETTILLLMLNDPMSLDKFLSEKRELLIQQTKSKLDEKNFGVTARTLIKNKMDEMGPKASVQDIMDVVLPILMEKVPKDIRAYLVTEIKKL